MATISLQGEQIIEVSGPRTSTYVPVVSSSQKIAYTHRSACFVAPIQSLFENGIETKRSFQRTSSSEKDPVVSILFVTKPQLALVTVYESRVITCHDESGQKTLFTTKLPEEGKAISSTLAHIEDIPTCADFDVSSETLFVGTTGGSVFGVPLNQSRPEPYLVISPTVPGVEPLLMNTGGLTKIAVSSQFGVLATGDGYGTTTVYSLSGGVIGLGIEAIASQEHTEPRTSRPLTCIARLPPPPKKRLIEKQGLVVEPAWPTEGPLDFLDGSESGCSVSSMATMGSYLVIGYSTGHLRIHSLRMIPRLIQIAAENGIQAAKSALDMDSLKGLSGYEFVFGLGLRTIPILAEIAAHVRSVSDLTFCPLPILPPKYVKASTFLFASASDDQHVSVWSVPFEDPLQSLIEGAKDELAGSSDPASLYWSINSVISTTPSCGPLSGVTWVRDPIDESKTGVDLVLTSFDSLALSIVPVRE